MKKKITRKIGLVWLLLGCLSVFSCKKTFDLPPENVLRADKMYQDVNDADAAIFGIYGKFIKVMDRYVVLNELRGDLLDVTPNADKYLRQLNEHAEVTADNPWADPRPYFQLILDCNDVMKNFNIMLQNKRISQANYNVRYSEVAAVWAWIYLQLGIHYGSVPYVTDALATIADAKDASKYPMVTFDTLLDKLIGVMSALPELRPIQLLTPQKTVLVVGDGASLIRTIDTYSTQRMFVNKQELLGNLYLWKGNYPMATHYLRMVLEYGALVDATKTDLYLQYMKEYPSGNGNALWGNLFSSALDADEKNEILTNLPFDRNFAPGNPFVTLFSHAGKYVLKPSALAIANWQKQTRSDGSPIDIYRGPDKSYSSGPEPEVKKLLGSFDPTNPFATNGKIILTRAGGVLLHYAESANRDGRDQVATAFLNTGFNGGIFRGPPPMPTNVSNIEQNFDANPDYYFDARDGTYPYFSASWKRFTGMRTHVSLAPVVVDSTRYFDMSNKGQWEKPVTDAHGLALAIENQIINEDGLEMAYEGVRWPDLLRIALRREKEAPGTGLAFLEAKIAAKFTAAGLPVPDGVTKLGASSSYWFLPFKL